METIKELESLKRIKTGIMKFFMVPIPGYNETLIVKNVLSQYGKHLASHLL